MAYDELALTLQVIDLAILAEEERGLAPGTLVAALFSVAVATLAHHFGWDRDSLIEATVKLVGDENAAHWDAPFHFGGPSMQ